MIELANINKIYIYKDSCDLRMGVQGLSVLSQELLKISEMKQVLFVFIGKNKRNIKILELDNDGWWLYQKKLFEGKYINPKDIIEISKEELKMLLIGLSVGVYRQHKEGKITINY